MRNWHVRALCAMSVSIFVGIIRVSLQRMDA